MKNQKKLPLDFPQNSCNHLIIMKMQKIVNLLDNSENEYPKFPTKEWYVVDSESKGVYSYHDAIKFLTKS